MINPVDALRRRVHGEPWVPTKEPTQDELLLRYIEGIERELQYLRKRESDRSWELSDGSYR